MRKISIFATFLIGGLSYYGVSKAEVPGNVYGFLDGRYYNNQQVLQYFCLGQNCYDINQNFVFINPNYVPDASPVVAGDSTQIGVIGGTTDAPNPASIPAQVTPSSQPSVDTPSVAPIIPQPSQAHLDLQAKCDADDKWYANQIQGDLDSASHNPMLNPYAPGTIVSDMMAKRLNRQQQCAQQLANLP